MSSEPNLALPNAANFLDTGLTVLGLLAALLTTILRGRLNVENNTRDLLNYMDGQRSRHVRILVEDVSQHHHSLSKGFLIVEEKALVWAQQLFSYYGATSGKNIDILIARWLHPHNSPPTMPVELRCTTLCKCLFWKRMYGVAEHLVMLANGAIFELDDLHDAIICAGCRDNNCHGFNNKIYHMDDLQGFAVIGSGVFGTPGPDAETLMRSVADLYVVEEGDTGLIMLEPANDVSTQWGITILEASITKDSGERGNENSFTVTYTKAIAGEEQDALGREEYPESSWWLSRLSTLAIASTLTVLFRTDAFSSVLLARRAIRGYITDGTGTKLPLQTFCSPAQSYGATNGSRRASVVLKPKRSFILHRLHLPAMLLGIGAMLEAFVVLWWIIVLVITPWFHVVGSSYLDIQPLWATLACAICVTVASSFNIFYYCYKVGPTTRRIWEKAIITCGLVDATVACLAILLGIGFVSGGHRVHTSFRILMMMGALLQWYLGAVHLGSMTTYNPTTTTILPYCLTFFRLLSLLLGAGRWA